MRKNKLNFVVAAAVFFVAGFFMFSGADSALAQGDTLSHNVRGWAWSGTVGWISFSCHNAGSDCNESAYGVHIDPDTGRFSGHAWASTGPHSLTNQAPTGIGWISFNDNGCPSGFSPPCYPRMDGNNIRGFAKALAADQAGANAGGWTGWISLEDTIARIHGLTLVEQPSNPGIYDFRGWGWGGGGGNLDNAIVGWVNFNSVDLGTGPGSGCPSGNCPDYKVWVNFGDTTTCPDGSPMPPSGNCPGGNPPDSVVIESGAQNYCDPAAGFGEFVYRINARPSGGNGEVSVEHDLSPDIAVNESPSRVNLPGNFEILLGFDSSGWDTEYRYFTEVGDVTSNNIVFRTPHQRPGLEYTIVDRPDLGDNFFEFEATGSCYDPAGCVYEWRFDGGSPSVASGVGPHEVEFSSGSVAGVLTVTNRGDGYSCPAPFGGSGTILPLPQWREVSPFNNR